MSEVKVNKISPRSGTDLTLGDSGDTITVPTGATLDATSATLTTPVISSISNTGTITLPTSTDTLVGRTTTDTLTNKTVNISSNTFTVDGTDAVGFLNTPVLSKSADYTLVLTDSGKTIFHPSSDTNNRTFTIPANSSVAYPIGSVVTFTNLSTNDLTIAITTDTMYLANDGSTGSRTLAQYGIASAVKLESTTWLISGNGLT